jgi:hypothetical protein
MPGVAAYYAYGGTLEELATQVDRILSGVHPDAVISCSHAVVQSGWEEKGAIGLARGKTTLYFQYSALILVRTA